MASWICSQLSGEGNRVSLLTLLLSGPAVGSGTQCQSVNDVLVCSLLFWSCEHQVLKNENLSSIAIIKARWGRMVSTSPKFPEGIWPLISYPLLRLMLLAEQISLFAAQHRVLGLLKRNPMQWPPCQAQESNHFLTDNNIICFLQLDCGTVRIVFSFFSGS